MTSLNTEMEMLLWSALLYIAQVLIAAVAADIKNGPAWALSNRNNMPAWQLEPRSETRIPSP